VGSGSGTEPSTPKSRSKRFSGFDFYRKKFLSSPPPAPVPSPPVVLQDVQPSVEQPDPTRGFHPLLSIYYLVRERMERERVYGPGKFASSQLSLGAEEPAASGTGTTPSKYAQPVPRLAAPPASHFSGTSYDAGPVPSTPTSAGPVPRARAKDVDMPSPVPPSPSPSAQAGQPSVPKAATHRRSHSLSQKPRGFEGEQGARSAGPVVGTFRQAERIREEGAEEKEARNKEEDAGELFVISWGLARDTYGISSLLGWGLCGIPYWVDVSLLYALMWGGLSSCGVPRGGHLTSIGKS
jgi:hypothetical protein